MPETAVRNLIELCHHHNVLVSTGGFLEHGLAQGSDAVRQYVAECERLGFDIIEISAGFISISTDDWLRLTELVRKSGLKGSRKLEFNWRWRRNIGRGIASRRHTRSGLGDCAGEAIP